MTRPGSSRRRCGASAWAGAAAVVYVAAASADPVPPLVPAIADPERAADSQAAADQSGDHRSRNGYLSTTITKIVNGHPDSRLDELLAWAYPAANALKGVA
jgi:hypothetical protein